MQHYQLIEKALHYLSEQRQNQPTLNDLAQSLRISEFHLQRTFQQWAGVSPKQFLLFLNREYLKTQLDNDESVLNASYSAGLSSTSRSHDVFVKTEGMTPAQYKKEGKGLSLHYSFYDSPFGLYLLAATDRGVCHIAFCEDEKEALQTFTDDWKLATINHNPDLISRYHQLIWKRGTSDEALRIILRGSPFQLKIWEALISIPEGRIASYQTLATLSGEPKSTRAAASAIAKNRIAWLIPCHRVIRKIGESGEYRWGKNRKRLILGWEAAQARIKG